MDIKLTVGMPMYRSERIGWVALESLCRQKDINFRWELIIAEEINSLPFGEKGIMEYSDRLSKVGCKRIKYIPIDKWVPLSRKWMIIAKEASESDVFLLQAADIYSGDRRLCNTYNIYTEHKPNWIQVAAHLFYDIKTDEFYTYNSLSHGHPCSTDMATETRLMKKIIMKDKKRSIDSLIYQTINISLKNKIAVYNDKSDWWKHTVNIHGLNNISARNFSKKYPRSPQYRKMLPDDILKRLQSLKQYAGQMPLIAVRKKKK